MTPADFVNLIINGTVEGLLIALPALALTLVMAIARFPNAATGDYMTIAAYAAVGVQVVLPGSLVLAALGALAAGAAVSLIFYFWVFRALRGRSLVASLVASIGVAFFARSVLTFFVGHDQLALQVPMARAWNFGGIRVLPLDLVVAAVSITAMALLFGLLQLTPVGRQMRAVADNADLARASGIRVNRVLVVLWAVVGLLCALGGALFGAKAVVAPELGWELLIPAFAAMILGGIGSPAGAVAGAILLGIAQELSVPLVGPSYKVAVAFSILLLVLLLRPRGLFGTAIAAR
ncbi:MAG: branched-chain amino acid ABC transporter permease [Betaproteobacteria bacterium]